MGIQIDVSSTTLNLNGHDVTGWSDDADALTIPDIDLANVRRGGDGQMVAHSTGDRGGAVMVKLLPTSDSTRFLMNAVTAQLNGGTVIWNGIVRNNTTGATILLTRGILQHAPLGQTVGKGDAANMEFTFEFESVIPDYSAADFS